MSKHKPPKTTGIEFLYLSMASFNGTKYAEKNSPEEFVDSYIAYKYKKKLAKNAELAKDNYNDAILFASHLLR